MVNFLFTIYPESPLLLTTLRPKFVLILFIDWSVRVCVRVCARACVRVCFRRTQEYLLTPRYCGKNRAVPGRDP